MTFDYGARGHLLGEAEVRADGTRGKQYRLVQALSPRGQVTDEVLGNCVVEAASYDGSYGLATAMTAVRPSGLSELPADLAQCPQPLAAGSPVRQVDYAYDHFLNLDQQVKNVALVQATETFEYDELHRLTRAARSWVGVAAGAEADTYGYDDLGNILSKSDYATAYAYGDATRVTRNAGPHAVAAVTKPGGEVVEFTYDANGNLVSGDGRTITFDLMDRAVAVTQSAGATTTAFAYAPDGSRYRQRVTAPAEGGKYGPKTIYYVAKDYELTVWDDGTVEERSYVAGSVVVFRRNAGAREVRYEHKDRLGSLDAVTADDAAATELYADAHGYDPWGKPRARDWTGSGERSHPAGDVGATTDRGFTGHEHLDVHYLIHMNGRVYDYRLGRFLSVDPIISNPLNSQSINPYSYIGNNPLSGVDPTGYLDESKNANPNGGDSAQRGKQVRFQTKWSRRTGRAALPGKPAPQPR